jgi:hypothetical protein
VRSRSPQQRRLRRLRLPARSRVHRRMLGPQGNTKQHISPHNARTTPTIVSIAPTASTGLAPLARMERYLADRDLPVRRILALVTVTAIIPTDAPLAPIENEIPLWKFRRVTLVVADYRVLVDQNTRLRNQVMATERYAPAMSRAGGPNARSSRSYSRPR